LPSSTSKRHKSSKALVSHCRMKTILALATVANSPTGHCTRPAQLDCSYQTICEGCGFFQTDEEFLPILRRQRDNAEALADFERGHIFKELIDGMTKDPPPERVT
jgi:hypothetical protein